MSSIGKTKGVYIALCLLLFTCLSSSAASQIETTDSLLHAYHRAATTNKHKMAQQLIDFSNGYETSHPEVDFYLYGHLHIARLTATNGGKPIALLGDWVDKSTYAVFDGETLTLN